MRGGRKTAPLFMGEKTDIKTRRTIILIIGVAAMIVGAVTPIMI